MEARFFESLGQLGAVGWHCDEADEVRFALERIFKEEGIGHAVRWVDPILDFWFPSGAVFQSPQGVSVTAVKPNTPRKERITQIASADAGIICADGAIAETGTIFHRSGGNRLKSVSLLPPVLVAFVATNKIHESMRDVMPKLSAWLSFRGAAQGVQFISGPSRSSDIENDLTIGVHGPGRVYVIALGNELDTEDAI